jgi:hypothetical protein
MQNIILCIQYSVLYAFWQEKYIKVLCKPYMAIKHIIVLFVETPRKCITAKLSIRKPGSSSHIISTDEDPEFTWCFHKQNCYKIHLIYPWNSMQSIVLLKHHTIVIVGSCRTCWCHVSTCFTGSIAFQALQIVCIKQIQYIQGVSKKRQPLNIQRYSLCF